MQAMAGHGNTCLSTIFTTMFPSLRYLEAMLCICTTDDDLSSLKCSPVQKGVRATARAFCRSLCTDMKRKQRGQLDGASLPLPTVTIARACLM